MNTSPSGRQPASVYRRRRITVAVIALLLIGLLGWGVSFALSALGGNERDGQGSQAQESREPGDDLPSAGSGQPEGMCDAGQVEVSASTDQNSYTADKSPVLVLTVKNTSEADCELNVGTSQQEFLVMSGSDRIFSTTDCAETGEDVILEFKAGQEESARFTWQRERSAPGCKAVNVQPRPGTYRFTAILGDIESDATTFELQ